MLFFHLYNIFCFYFFCFPIYDNIYPKYFQGYKKNASDITYFIFENYYKSIGFSKENNYYSVKRLKRKIYCCLQRN